MVYEADIHSAQRIEEKRRLSLVYKGGSPHLIFRGVSRVCLKTGRSAWVKERYKWSSTWNDFTVLLICAPCGGDSENVLKNNVLCGNNFRIF